MFCLTARLYFKSGQLKFAESNYKSLLQLNPDSFEYLKGLQNAKELYQGLFHQFKFILFLMSIDLDSEKISKLYELFEDLRDQFPRSHAIKRTPLNYATG